MSGRAWWDFLGGLHPLHHCSVAGDVELRGDAVQRGRLGGMRIRRRRRDRRTGLEVVTEDPGRVAACGQPAGLVDDQGVDVGQRVTVALVQPVRLGVGYQLPHGIVEHRAESVAQSPCRHVWPLPLGRSRCPSRRSRRTLPGRPRVGGADGGQRGLSGQSAAGRRLRSIPLQHRTRTRTLPRGAQSGERSARRSHDGTRDGSAGRGPAARRTAGDRRTRRHRLGAHPRPGRRGRRGRRRSRAGRGAHRPFPGRDRP